MSSTRNAGGMYIGKAPRCQVRTNEVSLGVDTCCFNRNTGPPEGPVWSVYGGPVCVKRLPRPHGAREIYQALQTQIEDGVYGPSDKLPSTRTLANEFGASRTTVTAAYEQLLAEGFIETGQGRRARVTPTLRVARSLRQSSKRTLRTAR